MVKKTGITVAAYLDQMLALSEKSQKIIAEEVGYEKPNIITMIKQGKTKLPVSKVGPFAKALGIDPSHLLRLVMSEYMPDTWDSISPLIGQSLVTDSEMAIIHVVREACGGIELDMTDDLRMKILELFGPIAKQEREIRANFTEKVRPVRTRA